MATRTRLGFLAILVLCFVSSLIHTTEAKIHVYDNKKFTKIENGFFYVDGESEALTASGSSAIFWGISVIPANSSNISVIKFEDITFVRSAEAARKQKPKFGASALVETIVFEAKDRDKIGSSFSKSDLCCNSELASSGSCNLGEVVIRSSPGELEWPKRIRTVFEEDKEEVKMSPEALVINKTGFYTVYFVTCDLDLDGIVVRGKSVWKNLDGYMSSEAFPLFGFHCVMFLAYTLFAMVLSLLRFWYSREGIQLHGHLMLVIGVSIWELYFMLCDLAHLYTEGTTPVEIILYGVTLTSLKRALSRILLLCISSGYGLVEPSSGGFGIPLRMFLAGVLCFLFSESLGLAERFGNIPEVGMNMLILFWAGLEAFFLRWIFKSLWNTIKTLQLKKRNIAKLQLYKKFGTVLAVMVVLCFAWIYVVVYVYSSLAEFWQVKWIIPAFYEVLSYVLLVLICFFWAPLKNPTRYLYLAEVADDEVEAEEALLLAEEGVESEVNHVEKDERKSFLEWFMILIIGKET